MPKENENNKQIQAPADVEFATEFNTREISNNQQQHKRKYNVTLDPRENRYNK